MKSKQIITQYNEVINSVNGSHEIFTYVAYICIKEQETEGKRMSHTGNKCTKYLLITYYSSISYDVDINVMLIYRHILWLKVATTPF